MIVFCSGIHAYIICKYMYSSPITVAMGTQEYPLLRMYYVKGVCMYVKCVYMYVCMNTVCNYTCKYFISDFHTRIQWCVCA